MKTEENKRTRTTAFITTGIVGAFFIGSSAFLYVDNRDLENENKQRTEQVETLTSVKQKLQTELLAIDAELSKYKGKNQEMDAVIKKAYKDLEERKAKITKLLKQNASLNKFKKEAEELRKMKKSYLSKMDAMEDKMDKLSDENTFYKSENDRLKSELEELNNNYMILERKVEIASALKVDKVLAFAQKKSKSGTYNKVSSSRKADRLIINFELSENRVADAEQKNIYIRIIDPTGKVLPAPSSDKGFFSNPDGNMELPYSLKKSVDYKNANIKTSATYEIGNQDLKDGAYTLEFYCEGYFCGASKYHLK